MAQSLRFGVSRARRVNRPVKDEVLLAVQEDRELTQELDALCRSEEENEDEDESLSSPFAVRSAPTPAELRKFF